jgi:hypothetical protein
MPNIKYQNNSFILSRTGEMLTVSCIGSTLFTLIAITLGTTVKYVSTTLYPFSYPFIHNPLHSFLPQIALNPPIPATPIFAALFTLAIYYFEKNVFYRRINLALKAGFASVAACALVFISNLLSILADMGGLGMFSRFFYTANVAELPALFIYYYLTSLPLFFISGEIRRKIYALP